MVFVGFLGVCGDWEFTCFLCGPLLVPIWLTILSIFTLGGFGCQTPFSSMLVSSSSWGGVWTRLVLLLLFLDWHTLWVEVSYFVRVLALCIFSWTFLSQLELWLSTSHALSFHPWGFSRLMTVIWRSVCSRIILQQSSRMRWNRAGIDSCDEHCNLQLPVGSLEIPLWVLFPLHSSNLWLCLWPVDCSCPEKLHP